MRSLPLFVALCATFFVSVPRSSAQTYTPKQILIKGAAGMDTHQLIGITALKPGPMTKQEIEAGMQRLADTGFFDDLSYTVSSDALIVMLTPSPSMQLLPVRYTNFVWWTPSELTTLIQARVPLYQGKLSLKGGMLDQVEAALVDILKSKGIDGEVTPIENLSGTRLTLAISRPAILLGKIDVQNSLSNVAAKLADMQAGFAAQEFDQQVLAKAIPLNITDLYNNAGFLDAAADPITFAPPRKEKVAYFVDASTTVHPGEVYRIRQLNLIGPPPLSHSDLEKTSGVKIGDPAGVFTLQHAADTLAHAYFQYGFLGAKATHEFPKDASTHTVDLTFTVTPGQIYHLAAIDASALPPDVQAAISRDSKLRPGVVPDQDATREIMLILAKQNVSNAVAISVAADHEHHLATITVKSSSSKH